MRDQLLGLPIAEKDWVVVGSNPESMLANGFKQVGKDFPVFLHAVSKEEYALARLERKVGPGYYGFQCDFQASVTLEEDLHRRDLTINAMAMDDQGQLIDPYGGISDLQDRILRHVSSAFVEDPVRVLRVARFLARFHHLGFRIAEETRELMYTMVKDGELLHLTAERVWQEWCKSLATTSPEQFIRALRACGALQVTMPEVDLLFGVPNSCTHHPEVDSGEHSLMVLAEATKLSTSPVVRFASFLHDLGKTLTPISQWPSHPEHAARGPIVIGQLCQRLKIPLAYKRFAELVAHFHLVIHQVHNLQADTIVKILQEVDVFRKPQQFELLLLACQADAQGRLKAGDYPQANCWRAIVTSLNEIQAKHCVADGFIGETIKTELQRRRIAALENIIHSWSKRETQS